MRAVIAWLVACALVIIAATLLLGLLGCTYPATTTTVTPPAPNIHVVDSAWQVVRSDTLTGAREITSTADLDLDIADYNATHTDDQWRLIYGEVPPVEAAPTADAYIVTADTHEAREEFHGIQRADLSERRAAWRYEVELAGLGGSPCVLYVDNVPPAPVPPEPVDPWVQYACYVVDSSGAVVFEEHPSAERYAQVATAYRYEVELHNMQWPADAWVFVTGRVYP